MAANKVEQLAVLGEVIHARRRELGLTQTELGARIGFSQERISLLERGTYGMPSLPGLRALASGLEWSLMDLLTAAGYLESARTMAHAEMTSTGVGLDVPRQEIRRLRDEKARLVSQMADLQRNLMSVERGLQSVEAMRSQVESSRERMQHLVRSCQSSML